MSLRWWEQVLLTPSQMTVRVDRNVDSLRALEAADTAYLAHRLIQVQEALGEKIVEVDRLRCALSSLTQLLVERGVVDEASIKTRFDEALSELARSSQPPPSRSAQPPSGNPYRDAPTSDEEPAPDVVKCQGCGQTVPAGQSNVTPRGVLCDACYGA
jgi:hypothetical protein